MVNRIVQTAHDVVAQAIPCDPDDKEIVRALGEDKFDGNACIGAADNRRKRLAVSARSFAPEAVLRHTGRHRCSRLRIEMRRPDQGVLRRPGFRPQVSVVQRVNPTAVADARHRTQTGTSARSTWLYLPSKCLRSVSSPSSGVSSDVSGRSLPPGMIDLLTRPVNWGCRSTPDRSRPVVARRNKASLSRVANTRAHPFGIQEQKIGGWKQPTKRLKR